MVKHTLLFSAFALAVSGAAMAHGTNNRPAHQARSNHAAMMQSDSNVIDRCTDMHYGEKVACLRQSRSGYSDQWSASGATSGSSGSGTIGAAQGSVRTPATPNETQPGQSSRSASGMK